AGTAPLLKLKEFAHIFFIVRVVVAEESFGHGLNVGGVQLPGKILRPRVSSEHDWTRRNILWSNASPDTPRSLSVQREGFLPGPASKYDRVRSPQRLQRLPQ